MPPYLGRVKGAKILFEGGADTAVANNKGHTLLQDCSGSWSRDIESMLLL